MMSLARRSTWGRCMLSLVLIFAALLGSTLGGIPEGKANILFILVDDLGFNDLSIHGSPDVKSPNIDKLGEDGAMFWNTYATAGFCSPSRASIMTGRNPSLFGYVYNPPHTREDSNKGIPPNMTLLPQTLRTAGYDTYMIGKWHLGFSMVNHPLKLGFKYFFGFLGGSFRYFTTTVFLKKYQLQEYIYNQWVVPSSVQYLTNDFTDKAIEYITRSNSKGNPFFIYLAYNTPHGPFQYKKEDLDYSIPPNRRKHVAMIKALDDDVGRLVQHLTDLGILEETLIVFTNDNGGHNSGANNHPLRKYKGSLYEGGIRVPFFTYWKGTISAGQNITHPITLMDVYPTAEVIARVESQHRNPDLEGKNLLPHIQMEGADCPEVDEAPHEHICIGSRNRGLVRKGDWKILTLNSQVTELYNLREDIGESKNLQYLYPAKAKELERIYAQCDPIDVPPLFSQWRQVNPINTLTLNGPSVQVFKNDEVMFQASANHSQGKSPDYEWEVFRPKQLHRANYNFFRVKGATVTEGADKTTASIHFHKTGSYIVRVTLSDGRWYKWRDFELRVYHR